MINDSLFIISNHELCRYVPTQGHGSIPKKREGLGHTTTGVKSGLVEVCKTSERSYCHSYQYDVQKIFKKKINRKSEVSKW